MLNTSNFEKLRKRGLELITSENITLFKKNKNTPGNFILEWRNDIDSEIECPAIELTIKEGKYVLELWDWTPGPGPGDFRLVLDNESDVLDFIDSYYYGSNNYFEERNSYEHLNRKTYTINDVELITKQLLSKLFAEFGNNEISYGERGSFNKISMDNWRLTQFPSENHTVNATIGILPNEVSQLRQKIQSNEEFNYEDINNISDLLFELSIKLKDKKGG